MYPGAGQPELGERVRENCQGQRDHEYHGDHGNHRRDERDRRSLALPSSHFLLEITGVVVGMHRENCYPLRLVR